MIKSQFKNYLLLLLFPLSIIVLAGGFNWIVDPYMIYNSPKIRGLNVLKDGEPEYTRMVKAYAVSHLKPQAVILGNSVAEIALDPDHPGWACESVYNLGIPAANAYEMLRYLQHAKHVQPLKQIIIGLDFEDFSIFKYGTGTDTENRLSVSYDGKPNLFSYHITEGFSTLFSLDTLKSSLDNIKQENNLRRLKENGLLAYFQQEFKAAGGFQKVFINKEDYFAGLDLKDAYKYNEANPACSPLTYYRQILQIAYQDNIELKMYISPFHSRLWELLAEKGLWTDIEEWKLLLVNINEEEARIYGKEPFPIWDFSYNEMSNETVPPEGDMETAMHWHIDPRHVTRAYGDLMLDCILEYHDPGRSLPDDFGRLLTQTSIDNVLQQIRSDRQIYRENHPDEMAYIRNLIK